MSDVTLTVGGRNYTVNCEDGQEGELRKLAALVDEKLPEQSSTLPSMEGRNLLFAALFLADELVEAKRSGGSGPDDRIVESVETIATRLEKAAAALEGGASDP